MKKIILSIVLLASTAVLFAQSDKYKAAMLKNLAAIDSSYKNPADLLALSNNFERIGNAEKTAWLPFYYAALCQMDYAFQQENKSKLDPIADRAEGLINRADSLMANNSEISCIKSMIATCRLLVNPMQRYQEFGKESSDQLDKAIEQDPTNPRPNNLRGEGLKNTPANFGGGCKTALPELQAAKTKFDAFKPATELSPNWGKERNEQLIKECSK